MIRTYEYIDTIHSRLNEYVLSFFQRIETDNGGFRDELFHPEFLPIVKRHRSILKDKFKIIYDHVWSLSNDERQDFCQSIIKSNEIENICNGTYTPRAFSNNPTGIDCILKKMFSDLYDNVLDGKPFRENANTTLREHFNQFSDKNFNHTLCPVCGIGELKKSHDKTREQYDHYLPKSLYPFSSVNFYNLVICCKECNSLDVKADKDILALPTRKVFFPYDRNHKDIRLSVVVKNYNSKIEEIEWEMLFSTEDNKIEEIESWKSIYSIDSRYKGYIKGRIEKWYSAYYNIHSNIKLSGMSASDIRLCYLESLEADESLGLSYIRRPTLEALLVNLNIIEAESETLKYT